MTTYVIAVKCERPPAELVRRISHVTGDSVGAVHRALTGAAPLVSAYVLGNDHLARREVLRGVVNALLEARLSVDARVYDEGEAPENATRLTLQQVLEALSADDQERARRAEFDDRTGHDRRRR